MIKFHQKDTKYVVKTMDYAAIKELGVLVFNYSIDNATGSTILNARFDTKEDFLRILVRNSQCKKTKIPIVHFPFSLIFPPSQNRTRKSETMTQSSPKFQWICASWAVAFRIHSSSTSLRSAWIKQSFLDNVQSRKAFMKWKISVLLRLFYQCQVFSCIFDSTCSCFWEIERERNHWPTSIRTHNTISVCRFFLNFKRNFT